MKGTFGLDMTADEKKKSKDPPLQRTKRGCTSSAMGVIVPKKA